MHSYNADDPEDQGNHCEYGPDVHRGGFIKNKV